MLTPLTTNYALFLPLFKHNLLVKQLIETKVPIIMGDVKIQKLPDLVNGTA